MLNFATSNNKNHFNMKLTYSFTDYEIAEILRVAFSSSEFDVEGADEMFDSKMEELNVHVLSIEESCEELVKMMVTYAMDSFALGQTVKCNRYDENNNWSGFELSREQMDKVLNEDSEVMILAYNLFEDEEYPMYGNEYQNKLLKIFRKIADSVQ